MRLTTGVLATIIAAATVAPTTANAQSNWRPGDDGSFRVRLGLFQPEGSSDGWDAVFEGFTGSPDDLEDLSVGLDFKWKVTRRSGLTLGTSFFDSDTIVGYVDWTNSDGYDIRHTTSLQLNDLTAIYFVELGYPNGVVKPYLGAGAGQVWYRLEESGSFIDFGSENLDIVPASYQADGTTYELVAVAGLDVLMGRQWSFFGEVRWREADDTLGDDYSDFGTLDLSGPEVSAGVSWKF
jgi:outer membrane protein W